MQISTFSVGVGGWVEVGGGVGGCEEKWRLRLNSAQFQLNLPAGAELGKIINSPYYSTNSKENCCQHFQKSFPSIFLPVQTISSNFVLCQAQLQLVSSIEIELSLALIFISLPNHAKPPPTHPDWKSIDLHHFISNWAKISLILVFSSLTPPKSTYPPDQKRSNSSGSEYRLQYNIVNSHSTKV